ncbi:MAG: TRAP transporter large permease [Alphaproteobacteria bacterium]
MTPLAIGLVVFALLIVLLVIGVPVAFALGGVAIAVLVWQWGLGAIDLVADTLLSALEDFGLVAVPLFIFMGVAASLSNAGSDMREMLKRWLHKIPGGLIVANICAGALFSGLSSTGAATCLAIGREGLPELLARRYDQGVAAGAIAAAGTLGILIPPSLTMIVFGLAGGFSIARLFLAELVPGLLLTLLFVLWAMFAAARWRGRYGGFARGYTRIEMVALVPKVAPFVLLVAAILLAFRSGIASPPEVAASAAVLCFVLVAVLYGMWRVRDMVAVLRETARESVAVLMILAAAALFSFMLTRFEVPGAIADLAAQLTPDRWQIFAAINVGLIVLGLFLPPIAVIPMSVPLLLPLLLESGFDPYWFAVVMTLNLQIGLITPPVGSNLHTVRALVPDAPAGAVLRGALPYVALIVVEIVLLSFFPEIATWLPDRLMGPAP